MWKEGRKTLLLGSQDLLYSSLKFHNSHPGDLWSQPFRKSCESFNEILQGLFYTSITYLLPQLFLSYVKVKRARGRLHKMPMPLKIISTASKRVEIDSITYPLPPLFPSEREILHLPLPPQSYPRKVFPICGFLPYILVLLVLLMMTAFPVWSTLVHPKIGSYPV